MPKKRNVDEITQWLQKAEVFASLGKAELEVIASHTQLYTYQTDETIFREGDRGDALFIVTAGSVSIGRETQESGHATIAELIPGDTFGEMELLMGRKRNAKALAGEGTVLLRVPEQGAELESILEKHPSVGAQVLHTFLKVVAGRIRNSNLLLKENSAVVQELRRQVYGDKLTGLYNKTYLEENLPSFLKENSTSLFLMKPDNFKHINDTYGHEAGDETLKLMARHLAHFMGDRGITIRYMGNELGVILAGTDRNAAKAEAEALLKSFHGIDLKEVTGDLDLKLSVSIGIAVYPEHRRNSEELINAAHELPLVGRAQGGNKILFPEDHHES